MLRRRREFFFSRINQIQSFFEIYKKLVIGIFWKQNSDISEIGIGWYFYHILNIGYGNKNWKVYHIAFYHILTFVKIFIILRRIFEIFTILRLSYSQKVYHIQFIIFNMIKSAFIHIFAIW